MITAEGTDTSRHDDETVDIDGVEDRSGDGEEPATVLRSPAVTAERERTRLEQTAGRAGAVRLLLTAGLAVRRLGSPQAAADGLRYRPVAWTIIAVLAVSWYLPGRVDRATVPEIAAAPSPVTTAVPSPAAPAEAEDPPPPDPAPGLPTPTFDPSPGPAFPAPSGAHGPAPAEPTAPAAPATASEPASTSTAPLTVRGSGWATRLPPTPLPTDDVPEGALPVANRIGSVDRVSFVRLAGDATTLELTEDEDSAREAVGAASVAACPIVDPSWSEEPEQSFDDAPAWDGDACVGGTESGGRWSFDLSGFDDRTGQSGFALVPTTDAPPDFQIAFVIS